MAITDVLAEGETLSGAVSDGLAGGETVSGPMSAAEANSVVPCAPELGEVQSEILGCGKPPI